MAQKRRISGLVVLPIALACVGTSAAIADRLAERATVTPPHYLSEDYCIKCHTDDKVLKAIRDKAGDPKLMADVVARYKASGQWTPPKDETHSRVR